MSRFGRVGLVGRIGCISRFGLVGHIGCMSRGIKQRSGLTTWRADIAPHPAKRGTGARVPPTAILSVSLGQVILDMLDVESAGLIVANAGLWNKAEPAVPPFSGSEKVRT